MNASPVLLDAINLVRANKRLAPLAHVDPALRLREDVGLDSLDLAELTARLHEQHRVDVFAKGLVSTVGEVDHRLRDGRKL